MALTKKERLELVFDRLEQAPPASSAEEALELVWKTLEAVEDEHSGVPYDPNPPKRRSERMFRPQADSIETLSDGRMIAEAALHIIQARPDGSIRIAEVVLDKKGLSR